MQNVIIGTAGHIDHGKTTLIRALTGRSTDKLKEEIKRGISINLGFTYFDLPSGKRAGIIDVPGHEKFIKNMLAGATGIDIVLLAIAANEGVKPQTIEHVDILSYLDIKERIVVLTKCDLADDVMLELVRDDIGDRLKGTLFEGAEIIEVDSLSMKGMEALIRKIDELSDMIKAKNDRAASRLHVDRIFSMKGFGTIVTGTLSEGTIKTGDELLLYPKMLKAKIRSIQVHDETVDTAYAGQRTALNLSNVKMVDIDRGDVLAQEGTMEPTNILDVKISLVNHTDWVVKLWERVRVYMGANEVLARLVPLDADKLEKGDTAFCQLRLEKTTVAKKNDKFVLRTFSPMETIGGGVVLDPNPKKHGKADKLTLEALKIKDNADFDELVIEFIRNNKEKYTSIKDVCSYISMDEAGARETLEQLKSEKIIYEINKAFFHADTIESFNTAAIEQLNAYHNKFPLRKGILKEELKSKITTMKLKEFDVVVKMLEEQGIVKTVDNAFLALYNFSIQYTKQQSEMRHLIESALEKSGFSPPPIESYTNNYAKENMEVFESLLGVTVIKLDAATAIHKSHYERAKEVLFGYMKDHAEITLAEFRDLTGSSRKYAVLLLDDFDKCGITLRKGEGRILRSGGMY